MITLLMSYDIVGCPYTFVKLKARWIILPRAFEVLVTPLIKYTVFLVCNSLYL